MTQDTTAPEREHVPLDRKHDEAIDWIASNCTAIRADNGNLDYSLYQMVKAFEAGRDALQSQLDAARTVKPLVWNMEKMDHRKTDGSLKGYVFEHFDAVTPSGRRYGFMRMTDCNGNHKTLLNDKDNTEVEGITAAKKHYKDTHERRIISEMEGGDT